MAAAAAQMVTTEMPVAAEAIDPEQTDRGL